MTTTPSKVVFRKTSTNGISGTHEDATYTSSCGRFEIRKRPMGTSRNGCWATNWSFQDLRKPTKRPFWIQTMRDGREFAQDTLDTEAQEAAAPKAVQS
jgi:hypothetical protein